MGELMRQCGGCTLCCKLLPVPPLKKLAGHRCQHQRHGKGCAVYETSAMPASCSIWNCRWLVNNDTADQSRPDRSHLVIDLMPDYITLQNPETGERHEIEVVQVWCDPHYPDAHKAPQFRRYAERRAVEGKLVLVRFNSREAITLIPPQMTGDGQWQEKGGQVENREPMEGLMHTKDLLAQELRAAGLPEMADKAATGYYHDFLSPLATPELQLEADLRAIGTPAAEALRKRHINGEFDASNEESEAWAQSPEGQETMRRLVSDRQG
jgi:hypothetical protein